MSRTTHPMSPTDEETGTEPTRSGPYVVPGTLLVAYLMATGRWGSHFGWWQQGIYVTDIALVVTAAWGLLRHRSAMRWDRARWVLLAPFVLIPAWALARLVVNWQVDQEALRDLAPFVYVLVGLVALVDVSRDARRRTLVVLEVALVLHAVWVAASTYLDIETRYPLSGGLLYVFEIRSDFDCAMLAVLAALSLQRVVRARRLWERVPAAFIMFACPYLIFQTGSRAGGLALVVAVLLSALSMLRSIPVSRTQLLVESAWSWRSSPWRCRRPASTGGSPAPTPRESTAQRGRRPPARKPGSTSWSTRRVRRCAQSSGSVRDRTSWWTPGRGATSGRSTRATSGSRTTSSSATTPASAWWG